jgi:hypothetical protein
MHEYEPKIVAFLDVLGFRTMTSLGAPAAEERIALVDRNLTNVAVEVAEHSYRGIPFTAKLFSDCISLSSLNSDVGAAVVLESVAVLSLWFAMDGLFLRGGIAVGRHFENERMIFSEGLVRAYELESTLARWPRTLVDESVEALALTHVPFLVRTDPHDGRRFVDYLEYCSNQQSATGHPYDSHKRHIRIALATYQANSRTLEKYEWLAAYHDAKLHELLKLENRRGVVRESMFLREV